MSRNWVRIKGQKFGGFFVKAVLCVLASSISFSEAAKRIRVSQKLRFLFNAMQSRKTFFTFPLRISNLSLKRWAIKDQILD